MINKQSIIFNSRVYKLKSSLKQKYSIFGNFTRIAQDLLSKILQKVMLFFQYKKLRLKFEQLLSYYYKLNMMEQNQRRNLHEARKSKISQIRSTLRNFSIIQKNTLKVNKKMNIEDQQQNKSLHSQTTNDYSQISDQKRLKAKTIQVFQDKYIIQKKIGQGANGFVNKCKRKKNGKIYAVKSLMIDQQQIIQFKKNFLDVKELKHPNISQYHALYLDMNKKLCYLVMEYVHYPNLSQIQIKNQKQLKQIIYSLLQTLQYMHSKHFCHRDIKLQNILYDCQKKRLKLIDFGTSKKFLRRNKKFQMLTMTGTMIYRAPQMFIGCGHTQKVDIWGAGVLIYKLVTGNFPFLSQYHSDTIHNIVEVNPEFNQIEWNKYEKSLRHLVIRMLKKDKDQRLSATQCLRDSWFYEISQKHVIKVPKSFKQIELNLQSEIQPLKVVRTPLQIQTSNGQIQNHIYKSQDGAQYHLLESDQDQIIQNFQDEPCILKAARRLKKRLSGPVKF